MSTATRKLKYNVCTPALFASPPFEFLASLYWIEVLLAK